MENDLSPSQFNKCLGYFEKLDEIEMIPGDPETKGRASSEDNGKYDKHHTFTFADLFFVYNGFVADDAYKRAMIWYEMDFEWAQEQTKFLNSFHSTIAEHRSSNRLSRIKSTVDPMALARSSWSALEKSVYCITKSPSMTPFFLSLLLHPPLLEARR